jgi:uncharacterized membrane protein YuzA (DUF378 family)
MVGVFMLGDSLLDGPLFFFDHKINFLIKIIGRTAVRIYYGILGFAAVVYGIISIIYQNSYSPL